MLSNIKQATISLGLYKPARAIHRRLFKSEYAKFETLKKLYSDFINPGDLVFDVGANIGARSEIFLALGARVIAFEPQPLCAKEVKARGNGNLTVVQAAVGSSVGMADLHLKNDDTASSLLPDWVGETKEVLSVPVTTLDQAIQQFGIPKFCKIDVEGFELEVLNGLSEPLQSFSVEYQCDDRGIAKLTSCLRRLSELGDFSVNIIGQEESKMLLPNWLSVDDFLESFPACTGANFYGDVFLRAL